MFERKDYFTTETILGRSYALDQATLIGGGGVFWNTAPQRKNFENTPLKILGKIFEKPGKLV